ncbi:MAG: adenylylsulfate reductase, partial [Bacillota bacterium]
DDYAGGISSGYSFNLQKLRVAKSRIEELLVLSQKLKAGDRHGLLLIHEVIDRLYVCKVLIHHLEARKETRWHVFQENADYPARDDEHWLRFVNSRWENGEVKIILRDLVEKDEVYEHND